MGFPRQEYWSRLTLPTPGDLPNPGIEPMSPVSAALAGGFFTTEPPRSPVLSIFTHTHTHTHTHIDQLCLLYG